jgi:hypothetical protein
MTYYFKYVCTQGLFSCIPLIRNFVLSALDYLPFKHFKSEYVQLLHAIFANTITNGRLENEKSNDVQKDGCWKLYSNNKKLTQILKLKSVTEICI